MVHRKLTQRDDGVVLVLVALTLTAMLVLAAFVVDLGYARQSTRHGQAAADSAALAGVQELPVGAADPALAAQGRTVAAGYAWRSLYEGTPPPLPTPVVAGNRWTYQGDPYRLIVETPYAIAGSSISAHHLIYVETCRPSPGFFAPAFGADVPEVCRASVARKVLQSPGTGIGLIALSETGCNIQLNGNNAVTISGGAVISNSNGTPAICSTGAGCGNWTIAADVVAAGGTIACHGNIDPDAAILEGAAPVPDPYASVPDTPCEPTAITTCGATGIPSVTGSCNDSLMTPGRFSSGCNLGGGNGTTQMLPGVYWFEGNFNIRNYDVVCSACTPNNGVLLYFHTGTLAGSGNGAIGIPPFRDHGDPSLYAGLSIYQRRSNTTTMTFGGTTGNVVGGIYAKGARLNLHGNVTRVVNGLIVAASVDVQGTTSTTVNPPPGGPTTQPVIDIGLQR